MACQTIGVKVDCFVNRGAQSCRQEPYDLGKTAKDENVVLRIDYKHFRGNLENDRELYRQKIRLILMNGLPNC